MTEYSENMNTVQTTGKQCLNVHKKVVRLKGHIYINTILPLINGQLFFRFGVFNFNQLLKRPLLVVGFNC